MPPAAHEKETSTRRILGAARELIARDGMASVGDIAAAAGVSKALVHYHFRDKDSLLITLANDVGTRVLEREQASMSDARAAQTLEAYWQWLDGELAAGDVCVLLSLAASESAAVRSVVRGIAERRRAMAATHVGHIFAELGLRARIPSHVLAETVTAFVDGLAASVALDPDRDPRSAFDVLWLALLSLTE